MAHHYYDPELLYVQCGHCKQPVLWEPGMNTRSIKSAGVPFECLDEQCIIITDACPHCDPERTRFTTQIFRITPRKPAPNMRACA